MAARDEAWFWPVIRAIEERVAACGGSQSQAARELGVSQQVLHKALRDHQIGRGSAERIAAALGTTLEDLAGRRVVYDSPLQAAMERVLDASDEEAERAQVIAFLRATGAVGVAYAEADLQAVRSMRHGRRRTAAARET